MRKRKRQGNLNPAVFRVQRKSLNNAGRAELGCSPLAIRGWGGEKSSTFMKEFKIPLQHTTLENSRSTSAHTQSTDNSTPIALPL